jgi:hypothetical protein
MLDSDFHLEGRNQKLGLPPLAKTHALACVGRRRRLHQYIPLKCPSFLLETVNQHSLKTVAMFGQDPLDVKIGGRFHFGYLADHRPLAADHHFSHEVCSK